MHREKVEAGDADGAERILAGVSPFEDHVGLQGPRRVPTVRRAGVRAEAATRRNRHEALCVRLGDGDLFCAGTDRQRIPGLAWVANAA